MIACRWLAAMAVWMTTSLILAQIQSPSGAGVVAPETAPKEASTMVAGAGSGQINGTVLDTRRKPVVGLTVAAVLQDGGVLYGTSTDATGRYAFRKLESGLFDVVVGLPGGGGLGKSSIRVRPLFRSIVDFTVPELPVPASTTVIKATPAPGITDPAAHATIDAAIMAWDREPAPDASITLTPTSAASGLARHARTGIEGRCALAQVSSGVYRIAVRSPGLITWNLPAVSVQGNGPIRIEVQLLPFPMGFIGTLEDLLIPADPIPPTE